MRAARASRPSQPLVERLCVGLVGAPVLLEHLEHAQACSGVCGGVAHLLATQRPCAPVGALLVFAHRLVQPVRARCLQRGHLVRVRARARLRVRVRVRVRVTLTLTLSLALSLTLTP